MTESKSLSRSTLMRRKPALRTREKSPASFRAPFSGVFHVMKVEL